MEHKNDYTCIVFYKSGKPKKWHFVHGLSKFVVLLNQNHPDWQYINVYERRTGTYLQRFYPNSQIPYFLTLLIIAISLHFFLTFNNKQHLSPCLYGFNNTTTIRNQKGGLLCL